MSQDDPRRHIPRTDALLSLPEVRAAAAALSDGVVRGIVRAVQDRARSGEILPDQVERTVIDAVQNTSPSSLRPVINATGVIIHTNLGRAPLSDAARSAITHAAGYVDVELDLETGTRSRRGAAARAALLAACPAAEDALVVNNGAAALVLATTAYACGREVLISRGEFVEIGAGFRLSDLIESTGAVLREVGTTNRTRIGDYAAMLDSDDRAHPEDSVGAILKVHPSNFRVTGFTAEASIAELAELAHAHGLPLIVDLGSGLLHPDPTLPDEPDVTAALTAGADVVIASGDKLLGGPQAGILLGRADVIATVARHPLARAVRADKLALAAIEATLTGGTTPVARALHTDAAELRGRTEAFARTLAGRLPGAINGFAVVPHNGRTGGGGGAEVPLPGWAISLPESLAPVLRTGYPAVLPRTHDGACIVDLRCVSAAEEPALLDALVAAMDAPAALKTSDTSAHTSDSATGAAP